MLMFEHALESVKNETGQLLIPFESLKLTEDILEKMFIKTAKKLMNKRPVRDVLFATVTPGGMKIKNALGVLALKYKIYEEWDRVAAPIERSKWFFNPTTRILRTLFASPFNIIYLREYDMGFYLQEEVPTYCVDGEQEIDFFLKGNFKKGTLKIKKGDKESIEVSRSGNIVTLEGVVGKELGTGTIDLGNNYKVNMNLVDTTEGNIEVEYYNKRIAIKDLEEYDLAFHTWFTVDVLRAIGSLKYQATLEIIPLSLQTDTILDRARELENTLNDYLKSKQYWWQWGY